MSVTICARVLVSVCPAWFDGVFIARRDLGPRPRTPGHGTRDSLSPRTTDSARSRPRGLRARMFDRTARSLSSSSRKPLFRIRTRPNRRKKSVHCVIRTMFKPSYISSLELHMRTNLELILLLHYLLLIFL